MSPADTNVLVVVIDRLNAGFLGPYGNSWVPTPAINRLASQALLAEFHFASSPELADAYRSYWQGEHPLAAQPADQLSLPEFWQQSGRQTWLITDEREVADLPLSSQFAQRELLKPPTITRAAAESTETHFADVIAAGIEHLRAAEAPFALWLHARGCSGPWDAPLALREHLRDEEDPEPPTFIEPPQLQLPKDYDPDELTAYGHAYAAQVMAIDECLESLFTALDESPHASNTLLVLTSPRGYLLGQQRQVGAPLALLLEDTVHIPLFVRFPQNQAAGERRQGLSETRDLYSLLQSWGETSLPQRDRLLLASNTEQVFRTPAWHLRKETASQQCQLFAKPDDRYEVNDVADRCQSQVEQLEAALLATAEAIRNRQENELAPLAEELLDTRR